MDVRQTRLTDIDLDNISDAEIRQVSDIFLNALSRLQVDDQ